MMRISALERAEAVGKNVAIGIKWSDAIVTCYLFVGAARPAISVRICESWEGGFCRRGIAGFPLGRLPWHRLRPGAFAVDTAAISF